MVKILFTSGGSQTALAMLDLLLAQGHEVFAGTRDCGKNKEKYLKKGYTGVLHFDLAGTQKATETVFKTFERIYFVVPGQSSMGLIFSWTKKVVDAALNVESVKFLMRMSSAGSSDNAADNLGQLLWKADSYLKENFTGDGRTSAVLAPTFFMENWLGKADAFKSGKVYGAAGKALVSYVAVKDIAEAGAALLNDPSLAAKKQHFILTGHPVADKDFVKTIADAADLEVKYKSVINTLYRYMLVEQMQVPEFMADLLVGLEDIKYAGAANVYVNDLANLIGREPTSPSDWAEAHAETFIKVDDTPREAFLGPNDDSLAANRSLSFTDHLKLLRKQQSQERAKIDADFREGDPSKFTRTGNLEPVIITTEKELVYNMNLAILKNKNLKAWGKGESMVFQKQYLDAPLINASTFPLQYSLTEPSPTNEFKFVTRLENSDHAKTVHSKVKGATKQPENRIWVVGGGTTIEDLQVVFSAQTPQETLLNQTGYNKLTISGTAAVSAQGSGLAHPAQQDMILSIRLFTIDLEQKGDDKVKYLQIEPKKGITNPKRFKKEQNAPGSDFAKYELIQDDDVFYSVVTSLGCFGIVTSLIVKSLVLDGPIIRPDGVKIVTRTKYLREHREFLSWNECKVKVAQFNQKTTDPNFHSYEVWLNPYSDKFSHKDGSKASACLMHWTWVEEPNDIPRPDSIRYGDSIGNQIFDVFGAKAMSWSSMIHLDKITGWFLDIYLKSTVGKEDGDPQLPIDTALDFGPTNNVPVACSAVAVDAKHWVEICDELIDYFRTLQKAKDHLVITTPIDIRCVAPSNAHLSMQYKRSTALVEIPLVKEWMQDNNMEILAKFRQHMKDTWNGNGPTLIDAKPRQHMGLTFDPSVQVLSEIWEPEAIAAWKANYKRFNKHGVFSNKFTQSMGFDAWLAEGEDTGRDSGSECEKSDE
eukprot:TRINITY_DN2041_c0_g1_i1.p1 TRINITY_DN2041_c0_g1~~TRINITY_DN2041_c0_g1_i1.p1  ORF type:complete len:930 (-),score=230.20 TRINITY_DN2041_c0_g1_i1:107-2896(-)